MKLLYATSLVYPSTRANRVQVRAMAKAFAKHLGKNFYIGVRKAPEGEFGTAQTVLMPGSQKSVVLGLRYAFLVCRIRPSHIFLREERLLFWIYIWLSLFCIQKPKLIFSAHSIPDTQDRYFNFAINRVDKLVVLTSHAKNALTEKGVDGKKIIVLPDGVEDRFLELLQTKEEARALVGIPQKGRFVVYNGHYYPWKGAHTLADAARLLPPEWDVYFVGGLPEMVEDFKKRYADESRLHFMGYQPYDDIPLWLRAGDVLVLPNSDTESISTLYTSPLKMIEFMAVGGNIVASRLPSLQDMLSEKEAIFFKPENPQDLAEKIVEAYADDKKEKRMNAAKKKASGLTWDMRAKKFLDFVA